MHRNTIRVTIALTLAVATIVPAAPADALTTGHTGSGRPALAVVSSRLYVAWTGSSGTAAQKQLVFGWSTSNGANITKASFTERVPQDEGPALDADAAGVYLAWPAGNNANTLTASYFNGTSFSCRTAFTGITTPHAPALASDPTGLRYLAWADNAGHLNVARLDSSSCATTHVMTLTNRVTLPDSTITGPALVWDDSGSSNLGFLLAWPDAAHVIHVATFTGTTLTGRSQVDSASGTATAPGLASGIADLYVSFRGAADGHLYLGYSEGCIPTCFNSSDTGPLVAGGVGMTSDGSRIYSSYFDPTGHLVISYF
jgi:hypothetical protein